MAKYAVRSTDATFGEVEVPDDAIIIDYKYPRITYLVPLETDEQR